MSLQTPGGRQTRFAQQLILTGSATPADDITRHTGAGRLVRLRMRTMSLHETGDSSGEVSLGSLLAEGNFPGVMDSGKELQALVEHIPGRMACKPRAQHITM